jgi:hypothetical protein
MAGDLRNACAASRASLTDEAVAGLFCRTRVRQPMADVHAEQVERALPPANDARR